VPYRVVKASVLIVLLVSMGWAFYGIVTIDEREAPRRSFCGNNLKRMGIAMHKYHDVYGCFPPAYVADAEGRPMHSWRVLLLEFMDPELYARFRLDEPWGSPHNISLLDVRRERFWFTCPSDRRNRGTETNYVMIVGPGSLSAGTNCVTLDEISDGTFQTIAVVEVVGSGIQWTEPRDLVAEETTFHMNDPERLGIGSRHPGGAQFLFSDGHTCFVHESTTPQLIRAMTTIAGTEVVSTSSISYLSSPKPLEDEP
jgi:prepilin-type processing-associated H-X9-DG protein